LKTALKYILQKIFGFRRYLYLFSLFTIWGLKWNRREKDFLHFLKILPENGAVLDIGANIGVMSYYLAKKSPGCKVMAFEPIPYNYENLLKIKQRFKLQNLATFPYALGDADGKVNMVMPVENSVRFHGLAHVQHESIQDLNKGEVFQCPVHKLDSIKELNYPGIKITGIKIDVENFEYYVLKGGKSLLEKHRPVIYSELWENENRTLTMKLLTSLKYSTKVIDNGILVPWNPAIHFTQNFFFLPELMQ
jgi:FkbM family methyltransferase